MNTPTEYRVTNPATGQYLGRMSLTAPLGWVAYGFSYSFPLDTATMLAADHAGKVVPA